MPSAYTALGAVLVDGSIRTSQNVQMKPTARAASRVAVPSSHAQRVGTSELRGNLAKYLKLAKAGTTVIIQERGRNAYVLLRMEDEAVPDAFGCMRDRTEYVPGAVVGAVEPWRAGRIP